ncbi:hypothetical protein NC652_036734 [Populus alba x Populus x berolinensis]|uniref:Secreted protein n=1 Tax=Populus alba x Populus x berolinensis TaxID=444605 RepID=A0AAD6PVZ0_9ROSI|nr:hypothetical protein NC652_036728 [Populus alba x Populus x berolinensis]KAJ6871158.1 hypothetical protein NC652_036734 [Populus alba x Populus x berolinensis]KAJ6968653.1 hypothetical protein NC653_036589 [Populus alba x Populus x berolinensis]KAJ6968660.1 hypothetical protein NC653_036595 [Populus alba x Populus x berolinensis]KAJ6969273.1 hypothetical protein NC653_037060 [Populus alba x Populus x berolinensis]
MPFLRNTVLCLKTLNAVARGVCLPSNEHGYTLRPSGDGVLSWVVRQSVKVTYGLHNKGPFKAM